MQGFATQRATCLCCGILLISALIPNIARALTADELLLVVNRNVPQGRDLAEYYAKLRKVPDDRIVELDCPTTEQMSFDAYEQSVVPPLRDYLRRNDPQNHIKCLVTFYGVPFRIAAHVDNTHETAELVVLHKQLKTIMGQLQASAADAESLALGVDPAFKPLVPGAPLADPQGSVAIDNIARRIDFAGKAAVVSLGKINDPQQQAAVKSQLIELVKHFGEPVEGLTETASATSGAATEPATNDILLTVDERSALEDRRFDPSARRTFRMLLAKKIGPLNYAKLLLSQIGYLATADSEAATDSELSLLKLTFYSRERWQLNSLNYKLGGSMPTQAMMVCRLDAPDPKIVRQMIVDSVTAQVQGLKGKFVIDSRGLTTTGNPKDDSYAAYDASLRNLAALVNLKTKIPVIFDEKPEVLPPHSADDVALYCGWYSVGNYIPSCTFVPGAVAFHVASYEMISLRDPGNRGWVRGLLNDGVGATLGPVSEPYLQSFPLADEFFPLLLTGRLTLAEIYWKTELMCSWRMCLVGDPLYTPFAVNPALQVSDLSPQLQRIFGIVQPTTTTVPAIH